MRQADNKLSFSIIIPSYNEGDDIKISIESALNQSYPAKEILIVDDSSDDTPQIIKSYSTRGVKLIEGPRKGCCGARNEGIKLASGDIVVLLNGDVRLPQDFLERIKKRYEAGADYVLVESRVYNTENFLARFIESQHRLDSKKIGGAAEWTEGFSCGREAALKTGLIPGDFKVRFCRDWMLGKKLSEAGFKKVIDLSVVVEHKAPDNLKEYWRVRKARGRFGCFTQYYLYEHPVPFLMLKFILKDIIFALKFLLIVPAFIKTVKIAKYSKRSIRDVPSFFTAYFLQELARAIGEWEGILKS